MLESRWINNNEDYKSNTGSNYASQNYHNDLAKAFGYSCALEADLQASIRFLDNEIQIKNYKKDRSDNNG